MNIFKSHDQALSGVNNFNATPKLQEINKNLREMAKFLRQTSNSAVWYIPMQCVFFQHPDCITQDRGIPDTEGMVLAKKYMLQKANIK